MTTVAMIEAPPAQDADELLEMRFGQPRLGAVPWVSGMIHGGPHAGRRP
jgi:hypothetical protein